MRWASRAARAVIVVLTTLLLIAPAQAAVPAHGRVWELVTSGPTNGVKLLGERAWSADGDSVEYTSLGPMPGSPSGELLSSNVAIRTPSGWTMQPVGEPITITTAEIEASEPLAVNADLTSWIWKSTQPLLAGAPAAPELGLYRREPDGTLTLLGPVGASSEFTFVAASENVEHVVFESSAHLLPGDAGRTSGSGAYEFAGDQLRLVDVDSAGNELSPCGSVVGNGNASTDALTHAVSQDGTRIFFTAPASGECGTPQRVYLRENGAQTIEVSASHCTLDCNAPQEVTFAGATPDGSAAFILTAQQLTNDDTEQSPNLYRYDVADGSLTLLSAGQPGIEADASAPALSSEDGQMVYFVASGQLVPGEGVPGTPSLYLSDHGTLRFVAPAEGIDLSEAEISADGSVLAFTTAAKLLPGDTDTGVELYRYDANTGALTLISENQGGSGNGTSNVTFGTDEGQAELQPDGMRWMSEDGSRIVFMTSESLLPEAVNTMPDIYEWYDGNLGLISSGAGKDSVTYGGMSANGSSVFFSTDETLVPEDRSGGDPELYDARLEGGFPIAPPPPPTCEEDACQGVPPPPSVWPTPASETFAEPPPVVRLRILQLNRSARRELARGVRAPVIVDAPGSGGVSLRVYALLDGHSTVVAHDQTTARGAGAVSMPIRLSAVARRALHRQGHLRLALVAHVLHGPATTLRIELK
jgi:hypothetical protein